MGLGDFERFTETGRGYEPSISINKSGIIGVNRGCMNRFGLQDYNYAILYYDKKGHRIGIRLINNEKEQGARKFRKRGGQGAEVSARSFLSYYGIDRSKTRRYSVEWDGENTMMVIQLTEEQEQQLLPGALDDKREGGV